MSYNFIIPPSPVNSTCQLTFHEYVIYDSINWTNAGNLYFNSVTGNYEVVPNPIISGLYYYDASNGQWTSINFNPAPNISGTMYYDASTKSITLI